MKKSQRPGETVPRLTTEEWEGAKRNGGDGDDKGWCWLVARRVVHLHIPPFFSCFPMIDREEQTQTRPFEIFFFVCGDFFALVIGIGGLFILAS